MNRKILNGLSCVLWLTSIGLAGACAAAEKKANPNDGGHLSIALGYVGQESPFREKRNGAAFQIEARYQWKGLFAEFNPSRSEEHSPVALGYNFLNINRWSFDLITAIPYGTVQFGPLTVRSESESRVIDIRRNKVTGAGVRAIGSWGNTALQLMALPYFNKHDEFDSSTNLPYASVWLSHRWQIRNWSITGGIGAKYRASELMNYYFGVSEREAADTLGLLEAYRAPSGIDYTARVDLTYPIRKRWVFQSYFKHTTFSSSLSDSPFIEFVRRVDNRPSDELETGILMKYVF